MKKNMKKSKLIIGVCFVVTVSLFAFLQSCDKSTVMTENEAMIKNNYKSLKPFIYASYDYTVNSILFQTPMNTNDLATPNYLNLVPSNIKEITPIRYGADGTSQQYNTFMENYTKAVKGQKLLSFNDYLSFGRNELPKLNNLAERKSAAFIIALGSAVCDYCHDNADNIKIAYTKVMANQKLFIDPETGLPRMNIFRTGQVVTWVAVAVAVVTAVVIAWPAALALVTTWTMGGSTLFVVGGTLTALGCITAGVLTFGTGILAYAGICPTLLNPKECRLGTT